MKTTIPLMFSLLLITGSLMGQSDKFKYADSDIKRDFSLSNGPHNNRQIDNNSVVTLNHDLFIEKKSHKFDLYQDSSYQNHFLIRRYPDFLIVEEYPGSSRFYGNPFIIKPDKNGKLLVKKPDTSAKYYLIIKDPVRHTIIR